MSKLLNSAAEACISGEEAGEILQAYIATGITMVVSHTFQAVAAQKPIAGDHLVEPR